MSHANTSVASQPSSTTDMALRNLGWLLLATLIMSSPVWAQSSGSPSPRREAAEHEPKLEAQRQQVTTDQAVHRIRFISPQIGWAGTYGSGELLHSEDGGRTWVVAHQLGFEYVEILEFLDAKVGFAGGDYGYLYRTEDGGKTWREVSPPVEGRITEHFRSWPEDDPRPLPEGIYAAYYESRFLDRSHGFLTGIQTRPRAGGGYDPIRFETRDGGRSWRTLNEERLRQLEQHAPSALPAALNTAAGSQFWLDEQHSWSLNGRRRPPVLEIRRPGAEGKVEQQSVELPAEKRWMGRKVWFLDPLRGIVVGGEVERTPSGVSFGAAVLLISGDGGLTWERRPIDLPAVHDLVVHGEQVWFAGADGMIAKLALKQLFP